MPRDITAHFIRERQMSPRQCRPGTYHTKVLKNGTEIVFCHKKSTGENAVQTVLKPR